MNAQHHTEGNGPATGAVIVPQYHHQEHEWTFARAFLYSITVLTTIGKCDFLLVYFSPPHPSFLLLCRRIRLSESGGRSEMKCLKLT